MASICALAKKQMFCICNLFFKYQCHLCSKSNSQLGLNIFFEIEFDSYCLVTNGFFLRDIFMKKPWSPSVEKMKESSLAFEHKLCNIPQRKLNL